MSFLPFRWRSVARSLFALVALVAGAHAQAPTADFSGTPLTGVAPHTVSFTNFTSGDATSWAWTFGDGGTSTDSDPDHTYTSSGTYTVSLTATGPGGSDVETKVGYVVVLDPPPVSEFSATPVTGTAPLTVNFTNASTGGSVTSRLWDFGDFGTSTALNPSHTYLAAGTYTVSLTSTGPGGSDTETKVAYVTVLEPAPVAEFAGAPLAGDEGMTTFFTDLSSGNVTDWFWTFGDGGTSTAQNPSHTYGTAGTFTVALTVTGPGGVSSETKTDYVVVDELPPIADFSSDLTSGLAPLTVGFVNLTGGGPATGGQPRTLGHRGPGTKVHARDAAADR